MVFRNFCSPRLQLLTLYIYLDTAKEIAVCPNRYESGPTTR